MRKMRPRLTAVLLLLFFVQNVFAEGTPQAMPNAANGVGLYMATASASGAYRGAPTQNRIRFHIADHNAENFYFGIRAYDRATTPVQVEPYYRIVNAAGTQVVAPTQITIAQQITTYARAVVGPNIGTETNGYTPLSFDPTANGEYYIEIYVSGDVGATATTGQTTVLTLFDFTVATPANTKFPGRVYSQAWSFITYTPATNAGTATIPLEGDFFGLTTDGTVSKIDFNAGFKPLAFVLYFNKYGVANGGNWEVDRRSVVSGTTAPSLANGYSVFLNSPDAAVFPRTTVPSVPTLGRVYGCAGNYFIPYKISSAGDVAILLDINGTAGFQSGTSDRYLFAYDAPAGSNVLSWDGLDGLGNAVSASVNIDVSLFLRLGRTNLPMYDAELNQNGFMISGLEPQVSNPKVYWNDAFLTNTGTTCGGTGDNNNNITNAGIDNSLLGYVSPARAWDGPGANGTVPAPVGSGGSSTTLLCDDYGNVRTLNSWFWSMEIGSGVQNKTLPGCSSDNDAVADATDVDDDNDGITDVMESGGVNPDADADSDGIPNYLDPTPGAGVPAYVDANNDGVNDAYDADGDGIINSRDIDGDNDGIPDIREGGGVDANNDGRADATTDVDGDGLIDTYDPTCNAGVTTCLTFAAGTSIPNTDSDGDGIPNARDVDSDNDGIPDLVEAGGVDTNGDGRIDGAFVDTDGDGLANKYDATTGGTAIPYLDTDGDGVPNTRDLDSDNDGIPDVVEVSGVDANGDGRLDNFNDADGDGFDDTVDGDVGNDGTAENTANALLVTGADGNADGRPDSFAAGTSNSDGRGIPNPYDLDSDDDGIADIIEAGGIDANNDGKVDGFTDTDGDGFAQSVDGDANNDGTAENTANALLVTGADADNNGKADTYPNDNADGGGMPNPYDLDSDNDGIPDLIESGGRDTDGDGRIDTVSDADGNGWQNSYDPTQAGINIRTLDANGATAGGSVFDFDGDGIANYLDLDADNDGIPDIIEQGGVDANNDGKVDAAADADNDGFIDSVDPINNSTAAALGTALITTGGTLNANNLPTTYSSSDNQDGSGLINMLDLDADNDGILDVREAGFTDTNNDGVVDGTLGTDGWSDTIDALASLNLTNTDGRGNANYLDIDADDDGIVDNVEGQTTAGYIAPTGADTDVDGIDDAYDNNDAAFAGTANNGLAPVNSDAIDLVDYLDLDSDNDGYPDAFEGHDTDGDNLPDAGSLANNGVPGGTTDADGDGLLDGYDNNTASVDATNGTNANSYPNLDNTGTAERDWREIANTDNSGGGNTTDIDDDNDGITDIIECGGFDPLGDADSDGVRNYLDQTPGTGLPAFADANNDGINDAYDNDQDGIINSLDVDSDQDGIADIVEAGGVDTNGDGRTDSTTDTDGDGLVDTYDTSTGGVNIANLDTDGDGIPNFRDLDSDNDGIPDVVEAGGSDANNDGKIDAFTDTDGDGFAQSVDGDANNDGTAENTAATLIITGTDGNADGRPDTYPKANTDKTGLPNPYDLDADGDGILDAREAGIAQDTNNNGVVNSGDAGYTDANGDGWADAIDVLASLNLPNTDGRGPANYLDIDADDDGITDNVEGQSTAGYILPTGTDSDGDGIDNAYDNNNSAFGGNANNGITPYNHDGADTPDYTDADSDNDGVNDLREATGSSSATLTNTTDTDNDGLVDQFDIFNLNVQTVTLQNNVTITGMGAGGSTSGPTPAGSNIGAPQSGGGGSNRDWRNALIILSVKLTDFGVAHQGALARIKWSSSDEVAFSHYVVERSIDGVGFSAIGTVAASGRGGNYSLDDHALPQATKLYYRLKMVNNNGTFTYSRVVLINLNAGEVTVRVYPNPVVNSANVQFVTTTSERVIIRLYDAGGQVVVQQNQFAQAGTNTVQLNNLNNLPAGTYLIEVSGTGFRYTQKLSRR